MTLHMWWQRLSSRSPARLPPSPPPPPSPLAPHPQPLVPPRVQPPSAFELPYKQYTDVQEML
jgi:hypothetical protein